MKKLLAVVALTLGFVSVSQASVMVEPYLGYEFGKIKDAFQGDVKATNLGLRLAYKTPVMLWVGVDGTYGLTGTYDPDASGQPSGDFNRKTTVYGTLGIDLPILLRAWLGYSLVDDVDTGSGGTLKGDSMKLGLGFTGLPFVSLNLEYIKDEYKEIDGTSLSPKPKGETYMFSVSLPLYF